MLRDFTLPYIFARMKLVVGTREGGQAVFAFRCTCGVRSRR